MGRRVPYDNLLLIHPVLYFSFFAVGVAASIAIITAMCSVVSFSGKQPSPPPTPTDPLETSKELEASSPPPSTATDTAQSPPEQPQIEKRSETECRAETENNEEVQITKELPLPPAMQKPKDSLPLNNMKRATSERRASFSLSMKMPRTSSVVARNWDQKEGNIKGKVQAEDPVWMKTIILGEKCVPGEEDPVIHEGKGNRISAYHPKNSSYMSLSRQCSFLDADALPVSQPQAQDVKVK